MAKRKTFYVVSDVYGSGLSCIAIAVFGYLCFCADRSGECFPPMEKIAENVNVSARSVQRAVQELVARKMIAVLPHFARTKSGARRRSSNLYRILNLPKDRGTPEEPAQRGDTATARQGDTAAARQGDTAAGQRGDTAAEQRGDTAAYPPVTPCPDPGDTVSGEIHHNSKTITANSTIPVSQKTVAAENGRTDKQANGEDGRMEICQTDFLPENRQPTAGQTDPLPENRQPAAARQESGAWSGAWARNAASAPLPACEPDAPKQDEPELKQDLLRMGLDRYRDRTFAAEVEQAVRTMYRSESIRVRGQTIGQEVARYVLRQLTAAHIEFVDRQMFTAAAPIQNRQAYLIACLYNAPVEWLLARKKGGKPAAPPL